MSQALLPIKIRRMQSQDLESIMAIEPAAFGSHHWSLQSFENELNNDSGCYFSATAPDSTSLLGYSGFWLIGEEAHITTLAVHPDYQGQYIGERLLINDILEAKKAGARWLTLEVRVSNEKAQNLYFKYGFKSISVRKSYYQDNDEDALVLWTENIETSRFNRLLEKRIEVMEPQFEAHPQWLQLKTSK
ncbi:MAG: ribosomal-protein-alanine N-acetyltransferase [Candidatus Melainabacteria bacterium]|nr:MAG: ribosomal-protein-alanine N-acetyltransferase [Candidatus Melainabacteria bacterium]